MSDSRGRDIISNLPDDILQHVFSFLDIKQVIQSTLLSKRFNKFLWKSFPILNFDHSLWNKSTHLRFPNTPFLNFVDQVFRVRDDSNIHKLRLCVGRMREMEDKHTIKKWFDIAINKHVREVEIFFDYGLNINVDSSVFQFAYDHVEVFKLGTRSSFFHVKLPLSMCSSSSLKTLKLESVALPPCEKTGELVLNCPMLENLFMKDCLQGHLKVLNICSPQLKNLFIENSSNKPWDFAYCKLKICDVKLNYFEYKGRLYEDCLLQNLNPLGNVALYLNPEATQQPDSLTKFIGGLSNAKMLTLKGLQGFPENPTALESLLIPLSSLRKLKLRSSHDNPCICRMASILKGCPILETFTWEVINVKVKSHIKDNKAEYILPVECILHHLKYIEVQGFSGHKNEVEFLIFLLKNTMVLEEMYLDRHTYKTRSKQCIEKLLASVALSPSAKISF